MNQINDLIPKHKSDFDTALKLFDQSYDEVRDIVPQLLEWIQDGNWPVAYPVGEFLLTISHHITDEFLVIFRGNDDVWKYWCLKLIASSDKPLDSKLLVEIRRIVDFPTRGEIESGVVEEAKIVIYDQERNNNIISISSTGLLYEFVLKENCKFEDFRNLAADLKSILNTDFIEKADDPNSYYWDFIFNDKIFTLHFNVLVGNVEILSNLENGLGNFETLIERIRM